MTPESAVRQLAATLLAREISPEVLATLQEPGTKAVLTHLEPTCSDILDKEWTPGDFEDAAVEYCRLFILTPAVPIRAAAWFEDNSPEIASRIQFMLDNGFLILPESFQTLSPDHLAVLLLTQTILAGEDATQFETDNLATWVPEFANALAEKTTHPLYRLAARLLKL